MNLSNPQLLLAGWLGSMSVLTFVMFGYDKWQAGRGGGRVSEASLWLVSAFGGWPGGLAGIILFRHKSAKVWFLLEFVAALFVWITLVGAVLKIGSLR
jgi:uncharacterized membrane protein YsdA (DUF1294 family)